MRLVYLYTTLNWYRLELFRSLSKLVDTHVYILNGYSVGYENIEFDKNTDDINLTILTKEESEEQQLIARLNEEEFDAIVVPSMNSVYTLNLTTKLSHYFSAKGKCVLYFWEYWPMDFGRYGFEKIVKQAVRYAYTLLNKRSIDYFITPSINTYTFYRKTGIPTSKTIRCFNASEITNKEIKIDVRKNLGIREEEKVVLYFGRIDAYKGIFELISAFKDIRREDWHLVVCGPGEEIIKKSIEESNNIHIIGTVDTSDRCSYYSAADVFVLPNNYKKKIEAWGLTVNEAMSYGLPIIATDATGSAEDLIFPGVNGYILDSLNLENELKYYLKKILSDDKLRKNMGCKSSELISEYSFDNMARSFVFAMEKYMIKKQ